MSETDEHARRRATAPGDWTGTQKSGWCMTRLHVDPDDDGPQLGYCRLPASKCGCPCHTGAKLPRAKPWHPPSPWDPSQDDDPTTVEDDTPANQEENQ